MSIMTRPCVSCGNEVPELSGPEDHKHACELAKQMWPVGVEQQNNLSQLILRRKDSGDLK